jgi:chromosome segregation ATPase
MKKIIYFLFVTCIAVTFFACGNKTDQQQLIDSLQTALQQRNADYQQLDEFLTVVSNGLDSISLQESDILKTSEESPIPNREQIKEDLQRFQQTLKDQRERISDLEKRLNYNTIQGRKMKAVIESLKAQLAEKESQVASLQDELNNKNITIKDLNTRLTTISAHSQEQEQIITSQNDLISKQDNALNEGYVLIASKKVLKDADLLRGGLLTKKKADYTKLEANKRMFRTIDTRVVTELEILSKDPTIMTQVPNGTYTMEKSGDKTILKILDPVRFWDASKYLIIQL